MGEVVLPDVVREVVQHMLELRGGASMVEVAVLVGKNEYESATGLDHSLPFRKSFDGVGDVLPAIRRQQEIVLVGFVLALVGRFPYGFPTRFVVVVVESLPGFDTTLPYGVGGEVDPVQSPHELIDGQ